MLKTLRWRLTLLYLLTTLGLVGLMGVGTYLLIDRYFQETTDLALQYKMATQFQFLGLASPPELQRAESQWIKNNNQDINAIRFTSSAGENEYHEAQENEEEDLEQPNTPYTEEGYFYNTDLAAIFVISLDTNGERINLPGSPTPPQVNSRDALTIAQEKGYDIRTVNIMGEGRFRLLTYSTGTTVPAYLQTGRLLNDQDRVLEQYLTYLVLLGSVSSIFLAFISWRLAGRSLGPAQKAWDQQQTFISNASHELRAPLTFIRATADYSLRTNPPPAQKEHLTDILNECDYMDLLVDDLLLLSRLDAHRLKLNMELIPLNELFAKTIHQVDKLAQAKEITVTAQHDNEKLYADRVRMRQALLIFLDNALRFTPAGGSIQLNAQKSGKNIIVNVVDNGKGIAPQDLPHLFERFYQVSNAENEASRSNGLGLSIARALIEAQNGTISIQSQPGAGATIRVTMPAPNTRKKQ